MIEKVIREMMAQAIQENGNHMTVLTVHDNGHSYELFNAVSSLDQDQVQERLSKDVLLRFNNKHKNMALMYMDKPKEVFERMLKLQLADYSGDLKELMEGLFINTHKARSPIKSLSVINLSLFHYAEDSPRS